METRRSHPFVLALLVASCMPYAGSDADRMGQAPTLDHPSAVVPPTAQDEPIEVGSLPADTTENQRLALWWVNTYRLQAGLGPIAQVASLNQAATDHALYVLFNPTVYDQGLSIHEESNTGEGFVGEWFWERMDNAGYPGKPFREVIAYQPHVSGAVAHWMETVYHRLPLLHPNAQHLGYGQVSLGKTHINVMDLGSGDNVNPLIPSGVVWPANGAVDVPRYWDGLETPQPPAPTTGYPSGPVITLSFSSNIRPTIESHSLRPLYGDTRGPEVDHVLLTPDNDPHLASESAVALYSEDPLQPSQKYEVELIGRANDQAFVRRWVFTTQSAKTCNLLDQDCSVGKGCYGSTMESATCAWAGGRDVGETCEYQNDCAIGTTCVSGTCRAYCQVNEPLYDCLAMCPNGWNPITEHDGLGVCAVASD